MLTHMLSYISLKISKCGEKERNLNGNNVSRYKTTKRRSKQRFFPSKKIHLHGKLKRGLTQWWNAVNEHKTHCIKAKEKELRRLFTKQQLKESYHRWLNKQEMIKKEPWSVRFSQGPDETASFDGCGSELNEVRSGSLMSLVEARQCTGYYFKNIMQRSQPASKSTVTVEEEPEYEHVKLFTAKKKKPVRQQPTRKPRRPHIPKEPLVIFDKNTYRTTCDPRAHVRRYYDRHAECYGHKKLSRTYIRTRTPKLDCRALPRQYLRCSCCGFRVSTAERFGFEDKWPTLDRPHICTCELSKFSQYKSLADTHKDVPLFDVLDRTPSELSNAMKTLSHDFGTKPKISHGTVPHFINISNRASIYDRITDIKVYEGQLGDVGGHYYQRASRAGTPTGQDTKKSDNKYNFSRGKRESTWPMETKHTFAFDEGPDERELHGKKKFTPHKKPSPPPKRCTHVRYFDSTSVDDKAHERIKRWQMLKLLRAGARAVMGGQKKAPIVLQEKLEEPISSTHLMLLEKWKDPFKVLTENVEGRTASGLNMTQAPISRQPIQFEIGAPPKPKAMQNAETWREIIEQERKKLETLSAVDPNFEKLKFKYKLPALAAEKVITEEDLKGIDPALVKNLFRTSHSFLPRRIRDDQKDAEPPDLEVVGQQYEFGGEFSLRLLAKMRFLSQHSFKNLEDLVKEIEKKGFSKLTLPATEYEADDLAFYEVWEAFTHSVGAKKGSYHLHIPETQEEVQKKLYFMESWKDYTHAADMMRATLTNVPIEDLSTNESVVETAIEFYYTFQKFVHNAWEPDNQKHTEVDEREALKKLDPQKAQAFLTQWKYWAHAPSTTAINEKKSEQSLFIEAAWERFKANIESDNEEKTNFISEKLSPAHNIEFFKTFRSFMNLDENLHDTSSNTDELMKQEFTTWLAFMQGITGDSSTDGEELNRYGDLDIIQDLFESHTVHHESIPREMLHGHKSFIQDMYHEVIATKLTNRVSEEKRTLEESKVLKEKASEESRLLKETASEESKVLKEKASEESRLLKEKASEESRLLKEKAPEESRLLKEKASEETRVLNERSMFGGRKLLELIKMLKEKKLLNRGAGKLDQMKSFSKVGEEKVEEERYDVVAYLTDYHDVLTKLLPSRPTDEHPESDQKIDSEEIIIILKRMLSKKKQELEETSDDVKKNYEELEKDVMDLAEKVLDRAETAVDGTMLKEEEEEYMEDLGTLMSMLMVNPSKHISPSRDQSDIGLPIVEWFELNPKTARALKDAKAGIERQLAPKRSKGERMTTGKRVIDEDSGELLKPDRVKAEYSKGVFVTHLDEQDLVVAKSVKRIRSAAKTIAEKSKRAKDKGKATMDWNHIPDEYDFEDVISKFNQQKAKKRGRKKPAEDQEEGAGRSPSQEGLPPADINMIRERKKKQRLHERERIRKLLGDNAAQGKLDPDSQKIWEEFLSRRRIRDIFSDDELEEGEDEENPCEKEEPNDNFLFKHFHPTHSGNLIFQRLPDVKKEEPIKKGKKITFKHLMATHDLLSVPLSAHLLPAPRVSHMENLVFDTPKQSTHNTFIPNKFPARPRTMSPPMTIPDYTLAISMRSATFSLPAEIEKLETMKPPDYLLHHVTPCPTRKFILSRVFYNFKKRDKLTVEGCKEALESLLHTYITYKDINKVLDLAGVGPHDEITIKLFFGLSALAERMVFPKFAANVRDEKLRAKYEKTDIELCDFRSFQRRLEKLKLSDGMKEMLDIIAAPGWPDVKPVSIGEDSGVCRTQRWKRRSPVDR